MKASCSDCGKTFSKKTKKAVVAALRMHHFRVHSGSVLISVKHKKNGCAADNKNHESHPAWFQLIMDVKAMVKELGKDQFVALAEAVCPQ